MPYTPLDAENRLDPASGAYGLSHDITRLSDGRYAVVWTDQAEGGLRGQILNADGTKAGGVFYEEPIIRAASSVAISGTTDGGFIAIWSEQIDSDYAEGEIYGASFNSLGVVTGSFYGNAYQGPLGSQQDPDIVGLPGGVVAMVWSDYRASGEVTGRINFGPEFSINAPNSDGDQVRPSITVLTGGNIVAVYQTPDGTETGLEGRLLDAAGNPIGGPFAIAGGPYFEFQPQVAALGDGGFVVTWHDEHASDDAYRQAVKAQVFNADASVRTAAFVVASVPDQMQLNPAVTSLASGGYVIAWQSQIPFTRADYEIYAQVFKADGSRDGGVVAVNTVTAGDQVDVAVAGGADGGFTATWTSDGTLAARTFAPVIEPPVDLPGVVRNGGAGADTLTGTDNSDRLYGQGGDDLLYGGDGKDTLYGGDGSDKLYGGDGADQISGGAGADLMFGGKGDDTYFVDHVGDDVRETQAGGTDTVSSSITYSLDAYVEVLKLTGSADISGTGNALANRINGNDGKNSLQGKDGDDSLQGYGGADVLHGGAGNDILDGGDGIDLASYYGGTTDLVIVDLSKKGPQNTFSAGVDVLKNIENLEGTIYGDYLTGDDGANKIIGREGYDYITGGRGNDDLRGGLGEGDSFFFERAGENGFDVIRDFEKGLDVLEFERSDGYIYSGLSVGATPPAGRGFFYNTSTHVLSYDADGAGGAAAISLATIYIVGGGVLSQADMLVL